MSNFIKIFGIIMAVIFLSILYVMPLWGMSETSNVEIKPMVDELSKEEFVLYAGVEEAFDIDADRNEKEYIEEPASEDPTIYLGWVTARVNIRKEPNTDSEVLDIIEFNEAINYQIYNSKWAVITYNNEQAYVHRNYISQDENSFDEYSVPDNRGFKSYMSYEAITNETSKQYKLQKHYAYTGNHGIRMIHNRYCIALGTYFNAPIGTYVDLELDNGTIIPCIVSEIKSDVHTNADNIVTSHNGCITEFLVDTEVMNTNAKRDGDISSCREEWNSPVVKINVYNKNIL